MADGEANLKRLYLVRHGQTEFNLAKLVQGRCDSPLTELGRAQALAAGSWLANHEVRPDAVGTSPLGRAFATTGLLMSVLTERGLMGQGVLPQVTPGLIERDYGTYERGPQADVPANVWDPGDALVACGGEGNSALRARVLAALRALLAPATLPALSPSPTAPPQSSSSLPSSQTRRTCPRFFPTARSWSATSMKPMVSSLSGTSSTPVPSACATLWIRPGRGTISPQVDGSKTSAKRL